MFSNRQFQELMGISEDWKAQSLLDLGKLNWLHLTYVTYLHKTSLKSRFLLVEFNLPHCTEQSVLQIGENQKSVLFLYLRLWNFENTKKIKS